jgi:hypothetical protein
MLGLGKSGNVWLKDVYGCLRVSGSGAKPTGATSGEFGALHWGVSFWQRYRSETLRVV